MASSATAPYEWLLAIISVAFIFSSFGNGANDVANSYATSVAARTLTMAQAGLLAVATEFVGAVALGARVTSTIKNGIITIDRFDNRPGALMLAMTCAEIGSAVWLMVASGLGLPVSTTHTVVGSLIGVGYASQSAIKWQWQSGSASQIGASWAIAPCIAGAISALLYGVLRLSVLDRSDPFKWAMRLIPLYLAFTASVLALFIVIELPTAPSLEEFGAGKAVGIILGTFFGVLAIAFIFFKPYFHRRIVQKDARIEFWHIPLGPLLWKEDPPLYFPGKAKKEVRNYYALTLDTEMNAQTLHTPGNPETLETNQEAPTHNVEKVSPGQSDAVPVERRSSMIVRVELGPHERFLAPVRHLPWTHYRRWIGYIKFGLFQGVTRECVAYKADTMVHFHAHAKRSDLRVEHLWTYCQVASAIMMSIAHGSNDVANAVGPWVATYQTYVNGVVSTRSSTPVWILVVAGFLLGAGFWVYGFHVVRSLGNRITRMSPTRGYCVELGAAITVLLASRLGLPVSTTQCLTGSVLGVSLMNFDMRATNWKHMGFIFLGWLLTLPVAGLISGLLCVMALNSPSL
ncbi:hypothetical protein H2204_014713 [Knufia peltigerae]|uniref:Phosphate transporter n=1 Tax=Knufia peltigerae TaxID=1002370 RepID=A0AA38XHR9_9EURO|nr:hypothetical protein H2204_014713 [Knufia peltigerae]